MALNSLSPEQKALLANPLAISHQITTCVNKYEDLIAQAKNQYAKQVSTLMDQHLTLISQLYLHYQREILQLNYQQWSVMQHIQTISNPTKPTAKDHDLSILDQKPTRAPIINTPKLPPAIASMPITMPLPLSIPAQISMAAMMQVSNDKSDELIPLQLPELETDDCEQISTSTIPKFEKSSLHTENVSNEGNDNFEIYAETVTTQTDKQPSQESSPDTLDDTTMILATTTATAPTTTTTTTTATMAVDDNNGKGYQCRICSKILSSRQSLTHHTYQHSGNYPFKCEFCNKGFATNQGHQSHRRIHTGEKPYRCEYCGRAFAQRNALDTHVRIHTGDEPFECIKCGSKFRHRNTYKSHIQKCGKRNITNKLLTKP